MKPVFLCIIQFAATTTPFKRNGLYVTEPCLCVHVCIHSQYMLTYG